MAIAAEMSQDHATAVRLERGRSDAEPGTGTCEAAAMAAADIVAPPAIRLRHDTERTSPPRPLEVQPTSIVAEC
jgi:hypothetical protein